MSSRTIIKGDLQVECLDQPGHGGACHDYCIIAQTDQGTTHWPIPFQNGPIKEPGVNGLTHEALLAILIDRLEHFQAGQYACVENANALEHLRAALEQLNIRTRARIARGVEGTHQK